MFWGESSSRKARRSLSTALWHIRRCFPDKDPIQGNTQTIQFIFSDSIELDIDEFEKSAALETFADLQNAIDLYRGDFLDGFYDDWVINERYRLQSLFIEALSNLMLLQESKGEYGNALQSARQLLNMDTLREDAHRLIMRVYCVVGQRNKALEQYHLCQQTLKTELSVNPAIETTNLFQDIQSGKYKIGQIVLPIKAGPIPNKPTSIARSPLDVATRQRMIGRKEELIFLEEQWSVAQFGQSKIVLVAGEAGIGKTRLLETFAENASAQGTCVLWGRCYEFERLLPYQPIAEALRSVISTLTPENIDNLPEWVFSELCRLLPDMQTAQTRKSEHYTTTVDQEQTRLFAGLNQFLFILSRSTPIILVLEDLHWATDSTLELLHYLVRHITSTPDTEAPGHPIFFVGSYRPELLENQHPLKAFQQRLQKDKLAHPLKISTLSLLEVEQLLSEMSGKNDAILPLARRLYQETEGNPFFLIETVKALFEMGTISFANGVWQGDFNRVSQEKLPLPAGISEVILARVHRMSDATQDVLRIAAVLGRGFDFDILTAVHGRGEDATLDALGEMLRHQVIVEDTGISERDYMFNHHKIQEVVYADIPRQRCQYIHAQVGATMEEYFSSQLDEVVNELAHHYLQAQLLDHSLAGKTACYLLRAGNLATKQFANEDAITYYTRALPLIPETDYSTRYTLLLAREKIYDIQGNRDAQKGDLATLQELARALSAEQQAEVMLRQASFARETGDLSSALESAQAVLDLAQPTQHELVSNGYLIMGQALMRQGEYLTAYNKLERGLTLARAASSRRLESYCLNNLGLTSHYMGNPVEAQRYLDEASHLYRETGDLRGLSAALNNLGVIANEQGDNNAAISFYKEALDIHRKMGNLKGQGMVLGNLGVIATAKGEYMQARSEHQQALSIAKITGHQLSEGNALLNLGNVYLSLGAYNEASEHYNSALDIYRKISNQTGVCWGLAYKSLLHHRLEKHESAVKYAQEALRVAEEIGDRHIQGYAWTHLGHALLDMERPNEARKAYQSAVDLRRELGEVHLAIESLSGLLRAYLSIKHLTEAISYLEEILKFLNHSSLEGMDEPLRVYFSCYQALHASDDPRAQQLLAIAHAILQEQATKIEEKALLHSFLENIPAHREIASAYNGGKLSTKQSL